MRYYMKSKFFKIKEDFWIKNEDREDAFFVDTRLLSLGLQFDLMQRGSVVYSVKERIIAFLPAYEVIENGNIVAKVNQKLTFMCDKIKVDSKYGDILIKGNIFDYKYNIYKNGNIIAKIGKEIFAFTDNYYVDIEFEDEAFILSLVVIIDSIIDKQRNNK